MRLTHMRPALSHEKVDVTFDWLHQSASANPLYKLDTIRGGKRHQGFAVG